MPGSLIRPPLTSGGKQRASTLSDAPRQLKMLARTQIPASIHGPCMVGAWVRGWCDGVRLRDPDENPYRRGGSGWHHAAATLYGDGWRAGKQVQRIDRECAGMTDDQFAGFVEVRNRARAILRATLTQHPPQHH